MAEAMYQIYGVEGGRWSIASGSRGSPCPHVLLWPATPVSLLFCAHRLTALTVSVIPPREQSVGAVLWCGNGAYQCKCTPLSHCRWLTPHTQDPTSSNCAQHNGWQGDMALSRATIEGISTYLHFNKLLEHYYYRRLGTHLFSHPFHAWSCPSDSIITICQ